MSTIASGYIITSIVSVVMLRDERSWPWVRSSTGSSTRGLRAVLARDIGGAGRPRATLELAFGFFVEVQAGLLRAGERRQVAFTVTKAMTGAAP